MTSLASPRAPAAPLGAALYESYYLTAADPAGGRALWLRFTALKRPGEPAHLTTWLTFFHASAGAPRALRVTAAEPLADPGAEWARSSLGEMGPSGTRGALSDAAGAERVGSGSRARWDLRWEPRAGEVAYLPARWLYDRPVPRSNGAALVPAASVTGTLVLDGDEVTIDGWEAMVGHNWGSEHAHQWCWMHAGRLGEDGRGWLDLALVRIRMGRLVTPWIASGAIDLDGRRYAPAPLHRVTCERAGERTSVRVSLSGRAALTVELTASRRDTVSWDYASPRGPGRNVDNCSVADARIALETTGATRSLTVIAGAAVEHGATP
ncbi:MAG TPA: hypothetical protein VHW96_00165 [Solirubrobacteraceae bacterium]|jgi:hypothetical protein|nr:hypothetical protein [Solirubrobacteraceae bacterium]